jgi:hypothetical protein
VATSPAVDAYYASVTAGGHALSIICSVDRGIVVEGLGALCSQLFDLPATRR